MLHTGILVEVCLHTILKAYAADNCNCRNEAEGLLKPRLHDTNGCQAGCTTGLTTGCIV